MTLLRWRQAQIAWSPTGHVLTVPHGLTERVRLRFERKAPAALAAVGVDLELAVSAQEVRLTGPALLVTDPVAVRSALDALARDVDARVQDSIAAEAPLVGQYLAALVGESALGADPLAQRRHDWRVLTTSGHQFPLEHQAQCSTCGWHGPTRALQDVALADARDHEASAGTGRPVDADR